MSALVPGSAAWHALRRTGIGGSLMPAIFGLSKWTTPYGAYAYLTGEAEPEPETPRQRWGRLMEPVVRLYYEEATGRKAPPVGFRRHPALPWLIGNADGERLEIKVFASGEGFGEPGTDEVPNDVLIQCHHYMILWDWPSVDVAVPVYANVPRIYTVEPDPIIHAEIIERGAEFWDRVQRRHPPEPISLDDARLRWGRIAARGQVVADPTANAAAHEARTIAVEIKRRERELEACKTTIVKALADRGDTLVDEAGNVLATWKMQKGAAGYTVEPRPPARRLLIKGEKA